MRPSAILIPLVAIAALVAAALYFALGDNDRTSAVPGGNSQVPARAAAPLAPADSGETENLPTDMAQLVRSEPRNPEWAPRSEASIRASMIKLPYIDVDGPLKVLCASTICEVSGSAPKMLAEKDLGQFWALLQSPIVQAPLAKSGLQIGGASFGRPGNPRAFAIYYRLGV